MQETGEGLPVAPPSQVLTALSLLFAAIRQRSHVFYC